MGLSWRDLIFAAGGLFLLTKGTREIHGLVEGKDHLKQKAAASLFAVIVQIAMFDLVFSINSIVTAVGMAEHLSIMIAAVVLAMIVMLVASGFVAEFINRHPTIKMLALSFLLLIGMALIADGGSLPHSARLSLFRHRLLRASSKRSINMRRGRRSPRDQPVLIRIESGAVTTRKSLARGAAEKKGTERK